MNTNTTTEDTTMTPSKTELTRGLEKMMDEWDRLKALWLAEFGNLDGFSEHFQSELKSLMGW